MAAPFAGKLLDCLVYLWNCSLKFVLNGKSSSLKSTNSGIIQGSILSPLLFIIFIDDITHQGLSNSSILYVDDVTLMAFMKSKEERSTAANSLNKDLSRIETLATSWNSIFGAAKCKTVTLECARSAWFDATSTSLLRLDAVQRCAIPRIRIIDLSENDLILHQMSNNDKMLTEWEPSMRTKWKPLKTTNKFEGTLSQLINIGGPSKSLELKIFNLLKHNIIFIVVSPSGWLLHKAPVGFLKQLLT